MAGLRRWLIVLKRWQDEKCLEMQLNVGEMRCKRRPAQDKKALPAGTSLAA